MTKLRVDKELVRAKTFERKGDIEKARTVYQTILATFPKNMRAKQGLARLKPSKSSGNAAASAEQKHINAAMALYNAGKTELVVKQVTDLLNQFPDSSPLWTILANAQKSLGNIPEAELAFVRAAQKNPTSPDAFVNLAIVLLQQHKYNGAIGAFERVLTLNPNHLSSYNNMGLALFQVGKHEEAIETFDKAIALQPDYAEAYHNKAIALSALDRLDEAIICDNKAIDLKPDYVEAHYGRGNAFKKQGKFEQACANFEEALKLRPTYANAHNNLGNCLIELGQPDDALKAYQRVLEFKPDDTIALNNMANIYKKNGNFEEARLTYERAIEINPSYADAHGNLGVLHGELNNTKEAIISYQRALAIKPDMPSIHFNIGNSYKSAKLLDRAIIHFERAFQIDPEEAASESLFYHMKQHCCDWSDMERMKEACARLGITSRAVATFGALAMEDNAERQMVRSRNWARETYKSKPKSLPAKPSTRPKRLRIAYFSADFYNHPCLYLMLGTLLIHDKSEVEVFVFSFSKKKEGELRERAKQAVDHFIDIEGMPNEDVIELVRSHNLDVAIDMTAYTTNSRSDLFQQRLAPVQVNYLGYPSTMGADFIDYIIADPTVIPASQRQNYTENVIYLPHSYLANDNTLPIADTTTTRADFDLPEDGFVICCFNNNYKISPSEFDIWMRVMGKVEGSVLWLLGSNKWTRSNLRREAEARGIDPDRLIFGGKVSHPEHMARHKHADIFVDTFCYNAHTTASESLWAGLPLVTKIGEQFAARVAASLLTSVGLPELITTTEEEYEALILDLAQSPDKVRALKEKLQANRLTQPLFNTERNTRYFEEGLRRAYDLYFDGQEPQDIWLETS